MIVNLMKLSMKISLSLIFVLSSIPLAHSQQALGCYDRDILRFDSEWRTDERERRTGVPRDRQKQVNWDFETNVAQHNREQQLTGDVMSPEICNRWCQPYETFAVTNFTCICGASFDFDRYREYELGFATDRDTGEPLFHDDGKRVEYCLPCPGSDKEFGECGFSDPSQDYEIYSLGLFKTEKPRAQPDNSCSEENLVNYMNGEDSCENIYNFLVSCDSKNNEPSEGSIIQGMFDFSKSEFFSVLRSQGICE